MTSADVLDALDDVTKALGRLVAALTEERRLAAVSARAAEVPVSASTPRADPSDWLSVAEVVEYTPRGFGERTVRAALADRSLTGRQSAPGHAWAIRRADVDAWIDSRKVDGGVWD